MTAPEWRFTMTKKKVLCSFLVLLCVLLLGGCKKKQGNGEIILRVANWEEYIDEGGWDEEELIDLEDGTEIIGENSLVDDFEDWYEKTYGKKVKVEYSTFGTNEELYNQLTLGDTFDLVCPSEYMIMKLMEEGELQPYSEQFFSTEEEYNYYAKGVSPYIRSVFEELEIGGEKLDRYGAGYMWGNMGIVYNPERVSEEEVKHWRVLLSPDYHKQITMKDSVRDSYIVAEAIINEEEFMSPQFKNQENYHDVLFERMNDTSAATVYKIEGVLSKMRANAYSLETDSGKADMVTGKVVANMQWSGDAVYTMDQADEDGVELSYSVPEESSNLWFDGWCMLKKGISQDEEKQAVAEAFVNFLSRPDNAIRNMYYIGYTSVIAGGESDLMFQYADWCYGAEDEDEAVPYDLQYFFSDDENTEDYVLMVEESERNRQVSAQYPSEEVISRCAVMRCFNDEENKRISQMWINIRCFDGNF